MKKVFFLDAFVILMVSVIALAFPIECESKKQLIYGEFNCGQTITASSNYILQSTLGAGINQGISSNTAYAIHPLAVEELGKADKNKGENKTPVKED